ncbi:MAG: hypothetical protein HY901_31870 [Deltaproteobacteria bacterium]|nr:hypothetical protein [Deltaproteobacteria bacterium]
MSCTTDLAWWGEGTVMRITLGVGDTDDFYEGTWRGLRSSRRYLASFISCTR